MVMKHRKCPFGSTIAKCYNIVNSEGFESKTNKAQYAKSNTLRKVLAFIYTDARMTIFSLPMNSNFVKQVVTTQWFTRREHSGII